MGSHNLSLQHNWKSMSEVLKKCEITIKAPKGIYTRLPLILEHGKQALKMKNDNITAFIMLSRWLESIKYLKNTKEYRNNDQLKDYLNENKEEEVRELVTELRRQLFLMFQQNSMESTTKVSKNNDVIDTNTYNKLPSSNFYLPETPTDDPLNSDSEKFITCSELLQLIKKKEQVLIIDIRPESRFELTRMNFDACINIPACKILKGLWIGNLEKYLEDKKDAKSLELFKKRGADHIKITVLIDTDTTSTTLNNSNHLYILRDIFEHWDKVKHPNIVILEGGYKEWMHQYPMYTINRHTVGSTEIPHEPMSLDEDMLESVEYPTWLSTQNDINNVENQSKILKSKISDDISMEMNNIDITNQQDSYTNLSKQILNNNVNIKPVIDRSNKPVVSKPPIRNSIVLELLNKLLDLAKIIHKLLKDILECENSLYLQEKDSTEEEQIQTDLEVLCSQLEKKEMIYSKEAEEFNVLEQSESLQTNEIENDEKKMIEYDLKTTNHEIKLLKNRRKKLIEEHEKRKERETTNIYKESLKSDKSSHSGHLERSHSSPNLLQMRDRKAPQVDRSSKPQITPQIPPDNIHRHIKKPNSSWNREERLNPVHGDVHPGITGLKNLGNSCYMNSIIQCLSNTERLKDYFSNDSYVKDIETNSENIQVVEQMALVIKALWMGKYKSISPSDLKLALGKYKPSFGNYQQQDSHEFLMILLEWIHNELRKEYEAPVKVTSLAVKEWHNLMDCKESIISDLFYGQLRSTITCAHCNKASTIYETFSSLTLSLPQSNRCSLDECIKRYISGQKVQGWKCPCCKTDRDATKKFDFVKLAPIIVIHLNRFSDGRGVLEKTNITVDFPITNFNMKQYLTDSDNVRQHSYIYNLYAMSNHYGTMEGGHYTAYCKNAKTDKWYKYDDNTVTEVVVNHLKSQTTSAYLLFYTSYRC